MIRIEVTNESDVTRMVAAFTTLPVLLDSDYEVFLAGGFDPGGNAAMLRAWRRDGQRGGSGIIHYGPGALGGFDGMGGGGGTGGGGRVEMHNHGLTGPCPPGCPSYAARES
jgi:hypothetical protein